MVVIHVPEVRRVLTVERVKTLFFAFLSFGFHVPARFLQHVPVGWRRYAKVNGGDLVLVQEVLQISSITFNDQSSASFFAKVKMDCPLFGYVCPFLHKLNAHASSTGHLAR